jgi:predicted acetyltransferase
VSADLRLERLDRAHRTALLEMAESFRRAGDDRYALLLAHPDAWLETTERLDAGRDLPRGRVPQTVYLLFEGPRAVAAARLRRRLVPALHRDGGHIGYEVRPDARGRGLGTALLGAMLERARAIGLGRVLLTAAEQNLASRRIIERQGGVADGTRVSPHTGDTMVRYWIDTTRTAPPVERP